MRRWMARSRRSVFVGPRKYERWLSDWTLCVRCCQHRTFASQLNTQDCFNFVKVVCAENYLPSTPRAEVSLNQGDLPEARHHT